MQKVQSFVHTLQAQSVQTRKTILAVASFGITALIIVFWLSSIAFSHTSYVTNTDTGSNVTSSQSPFAIIKDSVVEVYANASKGYDSATQK